MFSRKILRRGAMLCLFSSPFHSLHAQLGSSGGVSGIVRASDGSEVSGAKITVSGPGGFSRTTISAPNGAFSFVNLPSGTYTVQGTASGFAPSTQLSVPVAVGRNTQLTVTLALAGTQETVSVTATQSSFDSSQTSSVVNIDRDRVEELPIPNRNYLSFVALSPQARAKSSPAGSGGEPPFPVMQDPGCGIAARYRIAYAVPERFRAAYLELGYPNPAKTRSKGWILPIPATYVLDSTGFVVLSYLDADYTTRLEPTEIIVALTHLRREHSRQE